MEIDILQAIYSIHNSVLDTIMVCITHLGDAGILWIALALGLTIYKKTRKIGITMIGALILSLIFTNGIIKILVDRPRPYTYVDGIDLLITKPIDASFPSGHSSASFAAAVSLFIYNKKYGTIALIVASLIAFSRLYLFVHFPTDVLAGLVLGVVYALVSSFIVKKIYEKREAKAV